MKGKFVSGNAIENFLKSLLYEGNLMSYDSRIERLSAIWKLGLISCDEARHYYKSISIKFGVPESYADMLSSKIIKEV